MAEASAPEAPAAVPVPAPTPPTGKSKFTAMGPCPHCGEQKTVSHRQWCPKNPNRREHPSKAKARGKAATPKAKPAPKPKPAAKPKSTQDDFLAERSRELQADPKPAADKAADDKPDDEPKKPASWMSWVAIGVGIAGLLVFLWAWSRGEKSDTPELTTSKAPEPNSEIPGQGPVHVPGLPKGA